MNFPKLFLLINLTFCFLNVSVAQKKIGVLGYGGFGSIRTDNSRYLAESNYRPGINYSIGFFYERKVDSSANFRSELQYRYQTAGFKVKSYGLASGAGGYSTDIDYTFHQVRLNLDYVINLIDNFKKNKINLIFGFAIGYDVRLIAKGNGWINTSHQITDTSGNTYYYMSPTEWEKSENNSKDFKKGSFGLNFGLEYIFPMKNNHELILHNKYYFGFIQYLFFSGGLGVGYTF